MRRHKYNARRTIYNGVVYDSALEAKLAADIDLLIKSGAAERVERQVSYILKGYNGTKVCTHKVDFVIHYKWGKEVWEAKGLPTPTWRLKHKLFLDNYPNIKYVVHSKNKRLQ